MTLFFLFSKKWYEDMVGFSTRYVFDWVHGEKGIGIVGFAGLWNMILIEHDEIG